MRFFLRLLLLLMRHNHSVLTSEATMPFRAAGTTSFLPFALNGLCVKKQQENNQQNPEYLNFIARIMNSANWKHCGWHWIELFGFSTHCTLFVGLHVQLSHLDSDTHLVESKYIVLLAFCLTSAASDDAFAIFHSSVNLTNAPNMLWIFHTRLPKTTMNSSACTCDERASSFVLFSSALSCLLSILIACLPKRRTHWPLM